MIWFRHCLTICMSAVWFLSHIQSQSNYSVLSEIISCDSSLLSQLHLQLRVNHFFIETEWLIYASVDQTTMVSDNDSPPVQCPVISLTNDGVLNIRHFVIYPNEMSLEIKFLYEIELKNVGYKSVVILFDFYALINDETHMVFFYSRLLKQHSSGSHQNINKDSSAKLEVRLQTMVIFLDIPLPWRHNDHDGVSNRQPHDCLLNRLFRRRSKKHRNSASLAFVWGIHRGPVISPHKWPVTRKMFPFDDVIMHLVIDNEITRAILQAVYELMAKV